jgi:hypothetical protein
MVVSPPAKLSADWSASPLVFKEVICVGLYRLDNLGKIIQALLNDLL